MNYQHMFSRVVGVTLSLMLLGLLSLTVYAAGPAPEEAYQAIPAANHCAGISNDATGSTLLVANPELSMACRYASMALQKQVTADTGFANVAEPDAASSMDQVQPAQTVQSETSTEMLGSAFAAANPEVVKASRYTTAGSGVGLQKRIDTIQRFGLAEALAAEKYTASCRWLTRHDIQRLGPTEYVEAVEKCQRNR